jgi:CheY-like chemotaxis protein
MEEGDTLQRLLSRYYPDLEVASTASMEAAIDEAERSPARALVINDPERPMLTPDQERLQSLAYATPVFRCHVPDRDSAEDLGIRDFLIKPISRERLVHAIESLERPVETVLVVDDHAEVLQLFGRMLAGENGSGYRVLRASNGRRALQMLRRHKPDVVLLDLIMPELDGYGVLADKRSDPAIRDIPVLAISALDTGQSGIVSHYLHVSRGSGLSLQEFLNCLQTLPDLLAPSDRPVGRGQRVGRPA